MRINYIVLLIAFLTLLSCTGNDALSYDTTRLVVTLTQPDGQALIQDGIIVNVADSRGSVFKEQTDVSGQATFHLPVDIYQASVSFNEVEAGRIHIYNGIVSNIIVNNEAQDLTVSLPLNVSESGTLLIKELYVGGCPRDDGSGSFQRDKYVILYNNCGASVTFDNLCLGICTPYNAYSINYNYDEAGGLSYASEDFIPASSAIWYFPDGLTVEPYQEIVIALNGAVNHQLTYSRSINFAHPDYYCTYDPLMYDNTSYYPSPSEVIPTSHYLKALKFGEESEDAWPLSTTSPAFFVFSLEDGLTPQDFVADADNYFYDGGIVRPTNACKRVPRHYVLDAIEVYSSNSTYNEKRLTPDLDAGYISHTPRQGHSLHRKLDDDATASAGHPVYLDTNNSSNDFEELTIATLAGKQ